MSSAPILPVVLPQLTVPDMSPESAASWLEHQGAVVHEREGVLWARRPRLDGGTMGYWQPVAELSPFPRARIKRPRRMALGYRAVVDRLEDATGTVAVQWLADLPSYGPERVTKRRRNQLRKGVRNVELRSLPDPEAILRGGWPIAQASSARNGMAIDTDEAAFSRRITRRYAAGAGCIVGAFAGGLVAFMMSHAIDGIGYHTHLYVDTAVAPPDTASALYWATLGAFRRSGVGSVSFGPSTPELPGLHQFKGSFGVGAAHLPVITRMRAPVAAYLRRRRPVTYLRAGLAPPSAGRR